MVAGGVAVTPYLTLAPVLLRHMVSQWGTKPKSIVLHWVCRESGLSSFVVENYLKSILSKAKGLEEHVKFVIYVYNTRGETIEAPSSEMDILEESSSRILSPRFPDDNNFLTTEQMVLTAPMVPLFVLLLELTRRWAGIPSISLECYPVATRAQFGTSRSSSHSLVQAGSGSGTSIRKIIICTTT